jgi:hypothetical protein
MAGWNGTNFGSAEVFSDNVQTVAKMTMLEPSITLCTFDPAYLELGFQPLADVRQTKASAVLLDSRDKISCYREHAHRA